MPEIQNIMYNKSEIATQTPLYTTFRLCASENYFKK